MPQYDEINRKEKQFNLNNYKTIYVKKISNKIQIQVSR